MLAAAAATVALAACSPQPDRAAVEGRQTPATTAGQAVDNATLTARVKAALLADDQVKGTQINVDSNNGVVTLTGTVDSQAQLERAVEVARKVDGVQRVESNLTASATAAPGLVPGTQPPGTPPAATPLPNQTTERPPGGIPPGHPSVGQPATTAPADPANPGNVVPPPATPVDPTRK